MRGNALGAVLLSVCVVHCIAARSYLAAPLAACNRLRHPPFRESCDSTKPHTPPEMSGLVPNAKSGVNTAVKNKQFTLSGAIGILGLIAVLASGIRRLLPLALQPFMLGMSPWQWALYAATVIVFAYGEGYRAFQRGYAPMVVARSLTLPDRHILVRVLLATPYCMGLFHATRRRLTTSWGVLVGVNLLIVAIKYLPYPYRSIVDAGAVVGLSWGAASILLIWLNVVFFGGKATADPCLPVLKKSL